MGSSQSTRKVTVANESAHIIKVSDSVIERLKNAENQGSESKQSAARPVFPSAATNQSLTSSGAAPLYTGTLTSLQVLQEKEKQLQENDTYWANRVRELEGSQANTNRLMEQEFSKTVKAIEAKLPKIPKRLSEAPCSDQKAKVVKCFEKNPHQILLCAQEVEDFTNCVDKKRLATS